MNSIVQRLFCSSCKKEVRPDSFHSQRTLRVFLITKLCQECQDRAYREARKGAAMRK